MKRYTLIQYDAGRLTSSAGACEQRSCCLWLTLALLALVLMSCQPTEPAATPTATRTPILPTATLTPIPTSTPTATPTNTPTPTPTLPPSLVLTPTASRAENCPTTTADLFFLRDGRIWTCLAEGGQPEQLPAAQSVGNEAVVGYRVTQDGRHIAYVTAQGDVYLLDRARWQQTRLPTAGRVLDNGRANFAFSENGKSLSYLAWDVQLSSGPELAPQGSGVILSVDVLTPTLRQKELATCAASGDLPCRGFLTAPDGEQIAIVDGEGVWMVALPATEPARRLSTTPAGATQLHSWSPDSEWLLLETRDGGNADSLPAYTLISTAAQDEPFPIPQPLCAAGCETEATWTTVADSVRLWVTWVDNTEGCVASLAPTLGASPVQPVMPGSRTCEAQSLLLHPGSPMAGPPAVAVGGLVTFYQQSGPGVAAGIYALSSQAELLGVALLPDTQGEVLWAPNGEDFLYTTQTGVASHVGSTRYGTLWDVTDLFAGAHAFTWRSLAQD